MHRRRILTTAAIAAGYYAVSHAGQAFGVLYDGYAPFWPAAGFASGLLVVLGSAYAPGIAAGSLLVSLQHYPPWASLFFGVIDVAEPWLVAHLVRRFAVDTRLERPRDVVAFALAAVAGGAFSALGSAPVYLLFEQTPASAGVTIAGWTLGNAIGHFVVGGTLVVWFSTVKPQPRRAHAVERSAIAAATMAAAFWVFLGPRDLSAPRLYLLLALTTWIAVRLGQRAVGLAVLGISALAAWTVTRGTGPFTPPEGPALQAFLGVCGLAGFGVAAVATEREQVATLREREARYREMADASPNLMWVSRGGGHLEFVNARGREYTGATDLVEDWLARVHPDDRAPLVAALSASADAVHSSAGEARIRRRDGAYRWHWIVTVPVVGTSGLGPRWIGTATDIHDRKLAELELATWHAHYARAQAVGQLGSWESPLGTRGGPLVWSSELFRIFGLDPATFDGRIETFYARVHPEDRARVEQAAAEAVAGGPRYSIDHRIVMPDGEVRWVHQEADITEGADGTRRMVGICRDITERVRAEEARRTLEASLLQAQKLESLGILAGGIAHDFNNLLVGMLGNASLALLDLPEDAAARTAVQRIEISAQRAAELVRQMLAYSGKATMRPESVQVSSLVREMGDLLAAAISKRAVLRYDLAPDLPAVDVDATQLRQVVMNLITNASDALGDAPGVISITTAAVEVTDDRPGVAGTIATPGSYVQIVVADTGIGMDADTAARIFDPFFSTKFTGRGLGLAAVLGIVRGHRGALRLDTAPGGGTTFTVLLPVGAGRAGAVERRPTSSPAPRLSGTVLVVDDEAAVREAVSRMLERSGLDVVAVDGGRAALDALAERASAFRAVVLDLTMPDMSGLEVLRALRRQAPRLPVVVVSGYARTDEIDVSGEGGPQAFLQKPFTPGQLVDALQGLLTSEEPR